MAGAVFTPGQLQFVSRYAAQTGLNPQVVAAQVFNEMNGSAAASRQAAGDHDWLNIGRTDSGPRGAGDPVWNNPITAADASANWIKGTYSVPGFGKAASGITAILKSVGQGPAAQIQALQQSPWASSHYPNLPAVFQTVSGTKLPAASGVPASPMLPSAGPSLPAPPSPQRTMQSAQPNIVGALLGSLGQGPDALLRSLVNANVQAASTPQAPSPLPAPLDLSNLTGGSTLPTASAGLDTTTVPSGGKGRAGLAEAFYDPIGSWDNGKFGGPIGGHSDHVHISASTPGEMLKAIHTAQAMGLHVGENAYVGDNPEKGVHVADSFHYRTFPGQYGGKSLGQAIDVSGAADKMAEFYR